MVQMFGFGGLPARAVSTRTRAARLLRRLRPALGAPRHAPVLVENRWAPGPDELAVFFGVRELSGIFVKTLRVPATARAYILQGEQATEVPQGEYEIEGFFTRLNHLLRDQHAEILVTRSGALPVEFEFDDLRPANTCGRRALYCQPAHRERAGLCAPFHDHARHRRTRSCANCCCRRCASWPPNSWPRVRCATWRANRELRGQFDEHLQGGLALLLAQYGLAVVQVDTLALRHDKFDANRARIGTLWLAADERRVRIEHARQLDELYDEQEWHRIRREEQDSRLRHRRAELRQDESLERAELSLEERRARPGDARARDRAVRPHRRIAHAQAGDRTRRRRGAGRTRTRAGAKARRAPGTGRMAAPARAGRDPHAHRSSKWRSRMRPGAHGGPQRFSHQLLQQQIRNKIEQAQEIEDASAPARRTGAPARGRAGRGAARPRPRRRRAQGAPEAAAAGQRRRAGARPSACSNGRRRRRACARSARRRPGSRRRQQLERCAARAASRTPIAQHEKLLRTIEAERWRARKSSCWARKRRHQQRRAEQEAAGNCAACASAPNAPPSSRMRSKALGALGRRHAKLALAAAPNAALLAD
jgi:hypothetical protein